jgi:hypothetical protein
MLFPVHLPDPDQGRRHLPQVAQATGQDRLLLIDDWGLEPMNPAQRTA